MSKARVDAEISAAEAMDWHLLDAIEPWGERRADYRAAVICWTIAGVNYSGRGRRPQLRDFLKMFEFESKPAQSDEQIGELFDRIAAAGKKGE